MIRNGKWNTMISIDSYLGANETVVESRRALPIAFSIARQLSLLADYPSYFRRFSSTEHARSRIKFNYRSIVVVVVAAHIRICLVPRMQNIMFNMFEIVAVAYIQKAFCRYTTTTKRLLTAQISN